MGLKVGDTHSLGVSMDDNLGRDITKRYQSDFKSETKHAKRTSDGL